MSGALARPPCAIIFDLDGTLAETDDLYVERLGRLLRPLRRLFPDQDPRPFARGLIMAAETPINGLLRAVDALHLDGLLPTRRRPPHPRWVPVAGVPELLESLHGHYLLAVLSARPTASAMDFLARHGLLEFFHCVLGGDATRRRKPHPDSLRAVARKLGVAPQDCLMVGDTLPDIQVAAAVGAASVGVLCGFGTRDEIQRAGANLILESTAQLAEVLPLAPSPPDGAHL